MFDLVATLAALAVNLSFMDVGDLGLLCLLSKT